MTDAPSKPARPLRSQPARDRIVAAARDCFAAHGFERTTVRMIASDAQVAPAMLIRYFGSKEGVFAAAAHIDLRLPALSDVPRARLGKTLVLHFLERWEGKNSDGQLQALLRASVSHDGAREALVVIFETQLCAAISAAGSPDAAERAALVASQMLGLALARYVIALPVLATMDRQRVAAMIAPTIQRYLSAPLPSE